LHTSPIVIKRKSRRLVTGTLALGDDAGHLVNLSLATAEGTEPLLSELARALVLGVAEEFDDATLVGGEAVDARLVESWWWRGSRLARGQAVVVGKGVPGNLLDNVPHESSALAEVALGARNTGLRLARGDLLYTRKPGQPVSLFSISASISILSHPPPFVGGGRFQGGRT
jgi:hypothetical protein